MTTKNTPDTLPVPVEVNHEAVEVVGQAAALIAADDPWSDVSDGDLSPATARSIPLLALNRKDGQGFIDTETGEVGIKELDFIWLAKGTTRAWWPEAFGKGDKAPACRSADGIVPDPSSPEVQNPVCATCPNARWNGDEAPACKQSIEAMVFLPDPLGFGRLARIRFGGMAIKPAQEYWDSFSARLPRRPAIAYVSHIELEPTDTPNGTFLVPKFRRVNELSRPDAQPLIDERDRRISEWQSTVAEDVAAGATREREDHASATPPATGGSEAGTYETPDYEGGEPF